MSQNATRRSAPRLSSGIMGMKFMQTEDSTSKDQEAFIDSEPPKRAPNKFVHETDPGAWFAPQSQTIKDKLTRVSPASITEPASTVLSYSDLFETTPKIGRRSFGPKPVTVDPEQMVKKLPHKPSERSRVKKRPSEEGRRLSEGGSSYSSTASKSAKRVSSKKARRSE